MENDAALPRNVETLTQLAIVEEGDHILHKIFLHGRIQDHVVPRGLLHVEVQFLALSPHLIVEDVDVVVQILRPPTVCEEQAVGCSVVTMSGFIRTANVRMTGIFSRSSIGVVVLYLVENIPLSLPSPIYCRLPQAILSSSLPGTWSSLAFGAI